MPAARNVELEPLPHLGPDIAFIDSKVRKSRQHIDPRRNRGDITEAACMTTNRVRHLVKELQLDRKRLPRRIGNARRQIGELGIRVPLRLRSRLPMDEAATSVRRFQLLGIRHRDFDVIAEHVVVPHFQRRNAGLRLEPSFKINDHKPRVISQLAELVQRAMRAFRNKAAIARHQRQVDTKIRQQHVADRLQRIARREQASHLVLQRTRQCLQDASLPPDGVRQRKRMRESLTDGTEIPRAATSNRNASERTSKIRHAPQQTARRLARIRHRRKVCDAIKSRIDRIDIRERRLDPVRELTPTGRRQRPVDRGEQASLNVARQRDDDLEVSPRRCVHQHEVRLHLLAGRLQRRQLALLRQLQIRKHRTRSSHFRAREAAKRIQRGDTKMGLEHTLARIRVKLDARRHSRARTKLGDDLRHLLERQ